MYLNLKTIRLIIFCVKDQLLIYSNTLKMDQPLEVIYLLLIYFNV